VIPVFGFYLYHWSACVSFLNSQSTVHLVGVNSDQTWHERWPFMVFWPFGMMSQPEERRDVLLPSLTSDLIWPSKLSSNKCPKISINAGISHLGLSISVSKGHTLCISVPRSLRHNLGVLNTKAVLIVRQQPLHEKLDHYLNMTSSSEKCLISGSGRPIGFGWVKPLHRPTYHSLTIVILEMHPRFLSWEVLLIYSFLLCSIFLCDFYGSTTIVYQIYA